MGHLEWLHLVALGLILSLVPTVAWSDEETKGRLQGAQGEETPKEAAEPQDEEQADEERPMTEAERQAELTISPPSGQRKG